LEKRRGIGVGKIKDFCSPFLLVENRLTTFIDCYDEEEKALNHKDFMKSLTQLSRQFGTWLCCAWLLLVKTFAHNFHVFFLAYFWVIVL